MPPTGIKKTLPVCDFHRLINLFYELVGRDKDGTYRATFVRPTCDVRKYFFLKLLDPILKCIFRISLSFEIFLGRNYFLENILC